MPDRDLIAEGQRLLDAATPGTWYVHDANEGDGHPPRPLWVIQNTDAIFDGTDEGDALKMVVDIGTKADAELIAHMRNTYGQLIDELEQSRARVNFLESENDQNVIIAQAVVEHLDRLASPKVLSEAREYGRQMVIQRNAARERIAELEGELDATRKSLNLIDYCAGNLGAIVREAKQLLGIDVTEVDDAILPTIRELLDDLEQTRGAVSVAQGFLEVARSRRDQLKLAWEQKGLENDELQRRIDELERYRDLARDRKDDVLIADVELEKAHARIAELEGELEQARADRNVVVGQLQYARSHIAELERIVEAVRTALAARPRCDVHPTGDLVSCGWKLAVADVQRALDATEVNGRA